LRLTFVTRWSVREAVVKQGRSSVRLFGEDCSRLLGASRRRERSTGELRALALVEAALAAPVVEARGQRWLAHMVEARG
jgi:hypothetical protein